MFTPTATSAAACRCHSSGEQLRRRLQQHQHRFRSGKRPQPNYVGTAPCGTFVQGFGASTWDLATTDYGFFGEDHWKLTPRLARTAITAGNKAVWRMSAWHPARSRFYLSSTNGLCSIFTGQRALRQPWKPISPTIPATRTTISQSRRPRIRSLRRRQNHHSRRLWLPLLQPRYLDVFDGR